MVNECSRVSGYVELAKPLDLRPLLSAKHGAPWCDPECPKEGCVLLGQMINLVTTECSDMAGLMI